MLSLLRCGRCKTAPPTSLGSWSGFTRITRRKSEWGLITRQLSPPAQHVDASWRAQTSDAVRSQPAARCRRLARDPSLHHDAGVPPQIPACITMPASRLRSQPASRSQRPASDPSLHHDPSVPPQIPACITIPASRLRSQPASRSQRPASDPSLHHDASVPPQIPACITIPVSHSRQESWKLSHEALGHLGGNMGFGGNLGGREATVQSLQSARRTLDAIDVVGVTGCPSPCPIHIIPPLHSGGIALAVSL